MCYCGNKLDYDKCCGLFISGKELPKNPLETMKSRYSAFVVGAINYLIDSHHPNTRHEVSKKDIKIWSKEAKWMGLEILDTDEINENSVEGIVEFKAKYKIKGTGYIHREKSLFKKFGDRWYYHSNLPL
jgi:SEC-C motif-containing protein